jgi:hypothetical protein
MQKGDQNKYRRKLVYSTMVAISHNTWNNPDIPAPDPMEVILPASTTPLMP